MSWLDRLLGRTGEPASASADAQPPSGNRVEVEALGPDGWFPVELDIGAARTSDALNDPERDLDPRAADGAPVDLDDILLAIPPANFAGDPARRLHRPARQMWVRTGDWSVVGSLHLPAGTVGSAFLLRRNQRFFVLTDATITRAVPDGREERSARVLLVNLKQVSSLRDTPEPEREQDSLETRRI